MLVLVIISSFPSLQAFQCSIVVFASSRRNTKSRLAMALLQDIGACPVPRLGISHDHCVGLRPVGISDKTTLATVLLL